MKILMLTPFPGVRGPIPKHTPLLVDGLRRRGCTVTTEPWGRHADPDSVVERAVSRLGDVARIRRRLRAEHFDVMVVKTSHEWPSMLRDLPLLAATRRSVPSIVFQFHGGRSDKLGAQRQFAFKTASSILFRLSDGVLVLSSEEQQLLQEFWPAGAFHVVANPFAGVPDEVPASKRSDGPTILLFASRLIAEKGIFETLDAIKMLDTHPACRLVIAGSGPAEADVARRIRDLGIENRVTLAGFLSGDDLARAYREAAIFVLPTYWFEGFPTAITEAMAAGLPIITTATRGIVDHLEGGENAIFVPPRDARAIADAVAALVGDHDRCVRMAIANRAKVAAFSPEAVAEEYREALERIIASQNILPAPAAP
jgi:glycosyltransferase involved in cell wall biosynthesis